jgi:hypothetical protein
MGRVLRHAQMGKRCSRVQDPVLRAQPPSVSLCTLLRHSPGRSRRAWVTFSSRIAHRVPERSPRRTAAQTAPSEQDDHPHEGEESRPRWRDKALVTARSNPDRKRDHRRPSKSSRHFVTKPEVSYAALWVTTSPAKAILNDKPDPGPSGSVRRWVRRPATARWPGSA